jgi:hypothetical protein
VPPGPLRDLGKITNLVDHPQAVAVPVAGTGPESGQRIGDFAWSSIWHKISSSVRQMRAVPAAGVCRSVLAASSLAAITRSATRPGNSPAALAWRVTHCRSRRRSE